MLISSSPLSSAAWQTAPIHNSSERAQPVRSQNGPASTSQPANPPADKPTEHTASNAAQQKDAPGAEAPHRRGRDGHVKAQDLQGADSPATNSPNAEAVTGDAQALPFQTILNDVLPQTTEQAANPQHPLTPPAPLGQDPANAPFETPLTGKAAPQSVRSVALDPAFQIKKETLPAGGPTTLNQKLAGGEVAFAARVVERAGVSASIGLRNAQTVIAASRFDAPLPGASPNVDPQAALAAKKNDPVIPQAKAASAQPAQPVTESQLSGGTDANHDSQGDRTPDRSGAAAATLRGTSAGQEAATAIQAPQHNISGMPAAAPISADAGLRSPVTPKPAAETSAPQVLEPQGETQGRAGESVHNISLRLSNAEQGSVQVRLSERAGELHISVRTPDTGLTRGLRDGLPDLMGRLQVNGYKAETWQPGGNAGQERGQDAPSHGNSQHRNGGGSQQQNSQDQQQRDEQAPKWVSELESSIQRSQS